MIYYLIDSYCGLVVAYYHNTWKTAKIIINVSEYQFEYYVNISLAVDYLYLYNNIHNQKRRIPLMVPFCLFLYNLLQILPMEISDSQPQYHIIYILTILPTYNMGNTI